jgi:hypothetical protein
LEDNLYLRPFCDSGLSSGMFLAFLFGAFGAIVAEVLKRWQQWNDMPKKRFLALLKSIEFCAIAVFLILLSGSVGVFEGIKRHPIDWPYVSSSVSKRSAPYAISSPGWRRMGVRARNDDGLRGSLAAAEYPTVVRVEKVNLQN